MATKSIHGRYKVYKAGTKKVVDFLVSAGSKCADLKTVVKSLDCSLPFKSAKEPSNTSTANSEYGIRIHELLKLAHVIAATDPPLEVPEKVIENLKDVIAGRQSCADWYVSKVSRWAEQAQRLMTMRNMFSLYETAANPLTHRFVGMRLRRCTTAASLRSRIEAIASSLRYFKQDPQFSKKADECAGLAARSEAAHQRTCKVINSSKAEHICGDIEAQDEEEQKPDFYHYCQRCHGQPLRSPTR